jgi:hypothetical protein
VRESEARERVHAASNSLWYALSVLQFRASEAEWKAICEGFNGLRQAVLESVG